MSDVKKKLPTDARTYVAGHRVLEASLRHGYKHKSVETSSQQPANPPVDPRLLTTMYGIAKGDEIDLHKYWGFIRKRKGLILSVMLAAAILSAGISLMLPNVYKAQVLMAPVNAQVSDKSSTLAAMLGGSRLATLASLVSTGIDSSAELNLALMQSHVFLWKFIKDNRLMPVLFADDWDSSKKAWKENNPEDRPNLWDAYRYFTKGKFPVGSLLSVSVNKARGVVTVSVYWTDPVIAADWANRLVESLNNSLRKQAIARSEAYLKYLNEAVKKTSEADVRLALFTLIVQEQKKMMIADTQKQYAFRVIDPASPPDKNAKPKRVLIVILSVFAAGSLAAIFVLIFENKQQREYEEDAA